MYEYYFEGRKPSNAQVLKKINEAINQGNKLIEISWGENMITLKKTGYSDLWQGYGWIKNISGSDIAYKLNEAVQDKFINDRFQFVKVGF
jgi:hypothetical protein